MSQSVVLGVGLGQLDNLAALPGEGIQSTQLAVRLERVLVIKAELGQSLSEESLAGRKYLGVDLES